MKKILLIEDDRIMRENISELLDLVGYEVEVAINGKEGVKKAKDNQPDLIICDIKMPELDGYGVLHILNKDPRTASTPFIFVTAKTERDSLRRGMEMGADDYLTKPFTDTELLKTVETRLKKSSIVTKDYSNNAEGMIKFIKDANILNSLKNTSNKYNLQVYNTKDTIFTINNNPHFVYFIESGSVKTYRINIDGKELISNIYNSGDFFGYKPIIEERTYNEWAEALETCKILQILKDDFLTLLYKNRDISNKLIKIISKNLSDKEKELLHMAYDSVRKRVAIKLIELIPDINESYISMTRSDLAATIGTTTETIVRVLTDLKELNIIETNKNKISISDRNKLINMSKNW